MSVSMILMSVIGGMGTVAGPVVGAGLFLLLEQFVIVNFPNLHLGTFGVLLIAIVIFEPQGLTGWIHKMKIRRKLASSFHDSP